MAEALLHGGLAAEDSISSCTHSPEPRDRVPGDKEMGKEAGPGALPTRVPTLPKTLHDSRALSLI